MIEFDGWRYWPIVRKGTISVGKATGISSTRGHHTPTRLLLKEEAAEFTLLTKAIQSLSQH